MKCIIKQPEVVKAKTFTLRDASKTLLANSLRKLRINVLIEPCGKSDTDNIERTLRMGTVINLVIKDFNSIPKPSRTVLLGQVQKPNRGGKE